MRDISKWSRTILIFRGAKKNLFIYKEEKEKDFFYVQHSHKYPLEATAECDFSIQFLKLAVGLQSKVKKQHSDQEEKLETASDVIFQIFTEDFF